MPTFAQLATRIGTDFLNRSDLTSQVKNAIVAQIRTTERRRTWFNETQTAVVTSAGDRFVSLPSNFLILDTVFLTQAPSFDYELLRIGLPEIQEFNATNQEGLPTYFAYYNDKLELSLIPDASYTATISYVKRFDALSADDDTNAWLDHVEDVIAYGAAERVWATVLRNREEASYYRILRIEAEKQFFGEIQQKVAHNIRPTEF